MRSRGLVETCPLHIVHNSYLKALQTFGEDASELAIAVYHYFEEWPVKKKMVFMKNAKEHYVVECKYLIEKGRWEFPPISKQGDHYQAGEELGSWGVEDKEKYSREEDQEVFTKEDWIDRALRTGDTPKPKGSKMKRTRD
ncbi:UNVERIFIED_CONTAM: hypothetical protein K2H54_069544 [Gekko kuhli]